MFDDTVRAEESVVLQPGDVTSCPACNSGRWECWAEIENPAIDADGDVVGVSIEAGLTCQECGHVWIEVQP